MTTAFDSFDGSSFGAYTESLLDVRNGLGIVLIPGVFYMTAFNTASMVSIETVIGGGEYVSGVFDPYDQDEKANLEFNWPNDQAPGGADTSYSAFALLPGSGYIYKAQRANGGTDISSTKLVLRLDSDFLDTGPDTLTVTNVDNGSGPAVINADNRILGNVYDNAALDDGYIKVVSPSTSLFENSTMSVALWWYSTQVSLVYLWTYKEDDDNYFELYISSGKYYIKKVIGGTTQFDKVMDVGLSSSHEPTANKWWYTRLYGTFLDGPSARYRVEVHAEGGTLDEGGHTPVSIPTTGDITGDMFFGTNVDLDEFFTGRMANCRYNNANVAGFNMNPFGNDEEVVRYPSNSKLVEIGFRRDTFFRNGSEDFVPDTMSYTQEINAFAVTEPVDDLTTITTAELDAISKVAALNNPIVKFVCDCSCTHVQDLTDGDSELQIGNEIETIGFFPVDEAINFYGFLLVPSMNKDEAFLSAGDETRLERHTYLKTEE